MRKPLTYTLIFFCLGFANYLNAQRKSPALPGNLFKHITFLSFSDSLNFTIQKFTTLHFSPSQKLPSMHLKSPAIKDLPFFCALECRVQQQTRLWIKLRAGDDESYMKMIRSREK